ncbi:MAG: hypothetical protein PVG32_08410 [Anaerolineales bacterium]|jgi:hypothetical protein
MDNEKSGSTNGLIQFLMIILVILLGYLLYAYLSGSSVLPQLSRITADPLGGLMASLDGLGRGIGDAFSSFFR